MALIATQALVLEVRDYRESSLWLSLLTREQGRLNAIAKGARRAKSALAGSLQPFSVVRIQYSQRESGQLANLVAADLIEPSPWSASPPRADHLVRLAYAGLLAEVLATAHENDPHAEALFILATGILRDLASTPHPGSFALWGLFALLDALGYAVPLANISPDSPGAVFDLKAGSVETRAVDRPRPTPSQIFELPAPTAQALGRLLRAQPEDLLEERLVVSKAAGPTLLRLAMALFESHLEHPLRSRRFIEEMILKPVGC